METGHEANVSVQQWQVNSSNRRHEGMGSVDDGRRLEELGVSIGDGSNKIRGHTWLLSTS